MKLTTKTKYAVTSLLDIVANSNGRAIKLEDVSQRTQISRHYLEQLFRRMRLKGIVKSVRGPGGGYVLAKLPSEINLYDVATSVREFLDESKDVTGVNTNVINYMKNTMLSQLNS